MAGKNIKNSSNLVLDTSSTKLEAPEINSPFAERRNGLDEKVSSSPFLSSAPNQCDIQGLSSKEAEIENKNKMNTVGSQDSNLNYN